MLVSLIAWMAPAQAQNFQDPLTAPMGPSATAVLTDGTTLEGKPKVIPKGMGNIKKVTLKLTAGGKRKLKAADVAEFQLVPGGLAKAMSAMATMSSVSEMTRTDAGEVLERDFVLYVAGELPNGKSALLQVLNPGFDSTLRVFPDPAGRETTKVSVGGVGVAGGGLKSYLVARNGETTTVLVKKQQYDDLWDSLFGDCAAMKRPESPDFDDMAADVAAHAKACGKAAPEAPVASEVPVASEAPVAEGSAVP